MGVRLGMCSLQAPPHARGWTRHDCGAPDAAVGSPARAGMDLDSTKPKLALVGLPRTRGDGPA